MSKVPSHNKINIILFIIFMTVGQGLNFEHALWHQILNKSLATPFHLNLKEYLWISWFWWWLLQIEILLRQARFSLWIWLFVI